MNRILLGVLIVGVWLAMMTSLVRNHLSPPPMATGGEQLNAEVFAEDWSDIEEWMEFRWMGGEAGAAMASVRAMGGDEKGYRLDSRAQLNFAKMPGAGIHFSAAATLSEDFALDSFVAIFEAAGSKLDARGFVWGERLYFQFSSGLKGGARRSAFWPLDGPISLMESLRPLVARKIDLSQGAVYRIKAFDPVWFGMAGEAVIEVKGQETIELAGESLRATRVETTLAGRKTIAWVDESRSVLRYQMMEGLTLERSEREEVLRRYPQLADEMKIPKFDVMEYTYNPELIDLSQGNPMGTLAGLLLQTLAPQP